MRLLLRAAYGVYAQLCRAVLSPVLQREWRRPPYTRINERPVELAFALKWLGRLCPERVLDVGTGTTSWPHIMANCGFRVTAVDEVRGYWSRTFLNRHYHVINDDITHTRLTGRFDAITCLSVLEHIEDHAAAFSGMWGLLNNGGHLLLTCPYRENEYVDDAYNLAGIVPATSAKVICRMYSRRELDAWMAGRDGEIVEQEYHEVFDGEYWSMGERILPIRATSREMRHHLTCLVIRKNK